MKMLLSLVLVFGVLCVHNYCAADSHDPPVEEGGDGPKGNDWKDYNAAFNVNIRWLDKSVTPHISKLSTVNAIYISATNSHFDTSENQSASGANVAHLCFKPDQDYGKVTYPNKTQGEDFWDFHYDGYTPAITGGSGPTVVTNCASYAFDGYKSGAVAKNWVNAADSAPFTSELTQITWAVSGTRCVDGDELHVWRLDEVPCGYATASKLSWKNSESGIYEWAPSPRYNAGPKGWGFPYEDPKTGTATFYDSFSMYCK